MFPTFQLSNVRAIETLTQAFVSWYTYICTHLYNNNEIYDVLKNNKYWQRASVNVEIMDMESSVNCANDQVIIYDGKDSSSPIIARLCGSKQVRYSWFTAIIPLTYLKYNQSPGITILITDNVSALPSLFFFSMFKTQSKQQQSAVLY